MSSLTHRLFVTAAFSLALLSACAPAAPPAAPTAPPAPTAAPAAPKPTTAPAAAAAQPAGAARVIKHTGGETRIQGTPQRVVALEWTYTEDLVSLGVEPVGIADIAGYRKWVRVKQDVVDKAQDVGTRQEPNLEAILKLNPDLIIGVDNRHRPILDKLNGIAPTLLFDPYPQEGGMGQYEEMEQTLLAIADATDRRAQGQAVLKEASDKFASVAARLKAAAPANPQFLLVQAYSQKEAPQLRVFNDNGMAAQILGKLGLQNAWKGPFDRFGFNTIGVEALPAVEKANFFYVVQDDDNVFTNQLRENPVWKGLAFVKENRAYPLGADLWLFGGPASAQKVADKVASLLVK
jgi:ferric hydroxamate transport system substrate-binding protein